MNAGMEGLRDEIVGYLTTYPTTTVGYYAATRNAATRNADALLAPDGLLFPALRALGEIAMDGNNWSPPYENARAWLASADITGTLADACLAAAEVEL